MASRRPTLRLLEQCKTKPQLKTFNPSWTPRRAASSFQSSGSQARQTFSNSRNYLALAAAGLAVASTTLSYKMVCASFECLLM